MSPVHRAAREGYAGATAEYQRGRPEYPEALLPWLRQCLRAGPGTRVVELGAGTGKFTRLLRRSGAAITAVEPVEAMRATLEAEMQTPEMQTREVFETAEIQEAGDVEIVAGTAESTRLATGYADAVVCAQSFHWFANEAALAEMHRIIKVGGRLGLVWNVRDTRVPWVAAVSQLVEPYEGDTPRHHTGEWRRALAQAPFGDLHETVMSHVHDGSVRDVVVDRILSVSFIAALAPAERTKMRERVMDLVATHPQLRGRERVAAPYLTHAYWCARH